MFVYPCLDYSFKIEVYKIQEGIMREFFGQNMPALGFGCMRLPRKEDGTIDVEQCKVMTDTFLNAGLKYFDTAYVYEGSEDAVRQMLVERHDRSEYYLTSKLNARVAKDEEDAKNQLKVSLERTGAGYFDFYLLHAMNKDNYPTYEKYHLFDYVKEAKEKGLVKHWGFSFHDTPETLDKILTEHPDTEFVQLQINYADWDAPNVQSRRCYEVARKHGKPVVVMEPIKGGTLANPPESVVKLFKDFNPEASVASWAVRFVASKEGIMTVLSGMSSIAQMEDNVSYMADFKPLSEEESAIIEKAQEILRNIPQIPCTGCQYCTPGCPMQISIPNIFNAMNMDMIYGKSEDAKRGYERATSNGGKASECIHCLQCEGACPQHIEITKLLEEAAARYE